MGLEDREWFQEARAESRRAFNQAPLPPVRVVRRRRRDWTDWQTAAAGAAAVSLIALGVTGGVMWWRVVDFRPSTGAAVAAEAPEQPFPQSGTVRVHVLNDSSTPRWPFVIEGPGGVGLAVVRVRRLEDGQRLMTGYVVGDGKAEMLLPAGRYRVSVAQGRQWRGDDALFGRLSIVEEVQEPIEISPGQSRTLSVQKPTEGGTPTEGRRRAAF